MKQISSNYFGLQASWGLTKHMGGLKATEELVELCHINQNSYVLDVGCGVGTSVCYIARKYGCKVVGVDISEEMIEKAKKRAKKYRLESRVEFIVADAINLPFNENSFDAVISESVNAFIGEKQKAINEYKRVTKEGGYVGINEVTWIETPPTDLVEYLYKALGGAQFLDSESWKSLFINAGFSEIITRIYKTTIWKQWIEEVRQIDVKDFLSSWVKFFILLFKEKEVREYVKAISKFPKSVFKMFKYFGYGIYVGRK